MCAFCNLSRSRSSNERKVIISFHFPVKIESNYIFAIILMLAGASFTASGKQVESWLDVVRDTPYWASQGVAHNLVTIRRWVLLGTGYCGQPARQILFDRRGRFVSFVDDAVNPQETVKRLNRARETLDAEGRVAGWSPGSSVKEGYPFALACDQPDADITRAVQRLIGTEKADRLWGTWDGMQVGSMDEPVSLVKLIHIVHDRRQKTGHLALPNGVMSRFLGEVMIESGGIKHALSADSARGIMQLTPDVLDDCEIPEDFRLHRMAQVDCALRLVDQNDRNLRAPFNSVFGELPKKKRARLYLLLLTQAYQIGIGRTIELLQDKELGKAAQYFAAHEKHFSAADIQAGMIYHNLGRRDIGLMSLYYVIDVGIASHTLCRARVMENDVWCSETVTGAD